MKNSLSKDTEFVKIYLYAIVHKWFEYLANLKPLNEDLLLIVLVNVMFSFRSTVEYFLNSNTLGSTFNDSIIISSIVRLNLETR